MFSYKMVILKGIWIFSLSRYCFSQFSFFRHRYRTLISSACLMLELGFKQHDLVRTMFTGLATQLMRLGSVPNPNGHGPTLHDHDPTRSRPLRTSSILDRLHPIGFSRGGV